MPVAARRIGMGSTTHPRRVRASRLRTVMATITVSAAAFGVVACAGSDDDGGGSAATNGASVTDTAGADMAPEETAAAAEVGDMVAGSAQDAGTEEPGSRSATGLPTVPVADGEAIAIEARATVAVDDVRAAVDEVTTAVTTGGGRISVADVDYDVAPAAPEIEPPPPDQSRATLVAEVPPAELRGVLDALERIGTVSAYEQLAEDVGEQLTDLDTRIANERASIVRVRALIESAATLQDLVFLESELTTRETTLETLLASQRGLEDRVAMSTLTIEILPAPTLVPVSVTVDAPRPGVVDALADGWNAFFGAIFAIVLVLAVALPFLLVASAVLVAALLVRRALRRRPQPIGPLPADEQPTPEAPVAVGAGATASDPANRPR